MGSRRKALVELSHCATKIFHPTQSLLPKPITPISVLLASRLFSSSFSRTSIDIAAVENDKLPESDRDSMLLEKFRLRKLKGSSKVAQKSSSPTTAERGDGNRLLNRDEKVISGFGELGLCKEVVEAVEEMGFFVPSELHCVGIPALLEGKNMVLGSLRGPDRALAYLLPLIQSLKRDEKKYDTSSKHPRAFVLCSSEELCDEVFQMAKFISNYGRLKSAKDNGCDQLKLKECVSDVSIGMLIGTPNEICELIEEGTVYSDESKYLVLDELDTMFELGFGADIKKILSSVKLSASRCTQKCQSVLVTSTMIKRLHEQHSTLVESLRRDDAGEITAMLLEIEEEEAFHLMESPDTLKSKVTDAVKSLLLSKQGS